MIMIHNGHIRSQWLDAGMSRARAIDLANRAEIMLASEGYDFARRNYPHGLRHARDSMPDTLTATSPGGWRENHPGASTVKVRGCDAFRSHALAVLLALITEPTDIPRRDGA